MVEPYLPFRQVLDMLLGGVESKWQAGLISRENAGTIWQALPHTIPLLLQHAREFTPPADPRPRLAGTTVTMW